MYLTQAQQAVQRGMSARAVAAHSHFDYPWTRMDEREEQKRRKRGDPSLRARRERESRKLFVLAYIEYTAFHGPDKQYEDALRYLKELERLDPPAPDPPPRPSDMLKLPSRADKDKLKAFP